MEGNGDTTPASDRDTSPGSSVQWEAVYREMAERSAGTQRALDDVRIELAAMTVATASALGGLDTRMKAIESSSAEILRILRGKDAPLDTTKRED